MGTLTAYGEIATVTQATVAAEIHQALDVHLNFTAQVTFNGVVGVDVFADGENFGVRQFVYATSAIDAYGFADGFSRSAADTGDVSEGDWNPLCSRDVYAGDTSVQV